MADLHIEFGNFYDQIVLSPMKKEALRKSRNEIRERIRKHFREKLKLEAPEFHVQGSLALGTTINPLDGEFDIDDGVHLQHLDDKTDDEWPTPETVHQDLLEATDGFTGGVSIDKRTCVRIWFAGQYHVDLSIYAMLNHVCMKAEEGDRGWFHSDPNAITVWFVEYVKDKGAQLRRVLRYLMAWADYQSCRIGEMPKGLILTVLAAQYYFPSKRDDVSLLLTVKTIWYAVGTVFRVYNPVDIYDELTKQLSINQKKRFQESISALALDAEAAVNTGDREESSKLWRYQFGDRFPLIEEDEQNSL